MTEWFKYPISKEDLPKNQAYPIKPSEVGSLLGSSRTKRVRSVAFMPRRRKAEFIKAYYQGENSTQEPRSNERHPYAGTVTIWIFGVRREEKIKAQSSLRNDVLPILIEWLGEIENHTENWRQMDHNIVFKKEDGEVDISFDDNRFWDG